MKPWSVEECEAYAKQLRDKTRANTAEHAAQAIEYLLGLVRREWVGLTDEEVLIATYELKDVFSVKKIIKLIEAALRSKNT